MMCGSIWNSKILIRISGISAKSERTVKVGSLFPCLAEKEGILYNKTANP